MFELDVYFEEIITRCAEGLGVECERKRGVKENKTRRQYRGRSRVFTLNRIGSSEAATSQLIPEHINVHAKELK